MNFLKHNLKNIIIAAILGVVLVAAYYYFVGNSSSSSEPLTVTTPSDLADSDALLSDLGNLQQVKLNISVFSDPGFQALSDFNVDIPPQPIGNPDPFAPLPGTKPTGN
jgi:hypothetical protein